MQSTSRNMNHSKLVLIVKGITVSVISLVILCAVTAGIIHKGLIPQERISPIVMMILLTASFLGTKYSSISSDEKGRGYSLITGCSFILLLLLINVTILGAEINDILLKTISLLIGTALGTLKPAKKGRGRAGRKHRHNR